MEPVDDFRATNPASNQPLVEALGVHFRDSGFSLTELVRCDRQFSRVSIEFSAQRDEISQTHETIHVITATGYARKCCWMVLRIYPESLRHLMRCRRARRPKQIWTHRTKSLFLDTFGRPDPNQDPPCERTTDSTVVQSLHLMNSEKLHTDVLNDTGNAAKLAESDKDASCPD